MKRWEQMEGFLWDVYTPEMTEATITNYDVAAGMGISPPEATGFIQAYLDEIQKGDDSRALFSLHREGRTRNAYWVVGARAKHARGLGIQLADDVSLRIERAVIPQLERMAALNPRAVPVVQTLVLSLQMEVDRLKQLMEAA